MAVTSWIVGHILSFQPALPVTVRTILSSWNRMKRGVAAGSSCFRRWRGRQPGWAWLARTALLDHHEVRIGRMDDLVVELLESGRLEKSGSDWARQILQPPQEFVADEHQRRAPTPGHARRGSVTEQRPLRRPPTIETVC